MHAVTIVHEHSGLRRLGQLSAIMNHCKACGSPVCNPRERRLLGNPTSLCVRKDLCDFTVGVGGNLARYGEDHFSNGYLCKTCYMLVLKRSRLRSELEKIDSTILSNLRTVTSVFAFDDQQGSSCELVQGSKRGNQALQGSTPKRMRVNNGSGATVVVCNLAF